MKAPKQLRSAVIISIFFLILLLSSCSSFKPGQAETPPGGYEKIDTLVLDQRNWNWFFRTGIDERIKNLEAMAETEAHRKYGDDVIIITESIEGCWNPASLLMLLNTMGFVEDSSISVSVWRKLPEPAPVNYGYRWVVVPEADYSGDWGFMQVEYKTRAQLEEALKLSFEEGQISKESFDLRMGRLPDTGKIYITLARAEITNAISRWFTFTCTWEGKTIFRKKGIEDIPYVYGTDKFWWNDMSYNVGPAWSGELDLRIEDHFRNEVFNFKIIKEKYVIEE